MIAPSGETVAVPDEALASASLAGYKPESEAHGTARSAHEGELANYSGTLDTIKAGVTGALSTASLGLTDVLGDSHENALLREAHPTASTIGQTAAMFFSPEGTPAAAVSSIGRGISEAGGLVSAIKGAAFEGAAFNTGSYISDVALGDRDLSAEGFIGSAGAGALWGGSAGAAFHGLGSGFVAARDLFPRSGVASKGALAAAEHETTKSLTAAADAAAPLVDAAKARISEIKYAGEQVAQDAAKSRYTLNATTAARRAETDAAMGAARTDPALAGVHDEVARASAGADVAADAAHAALDSHVASTGTAIAGDVDHISALAAEVEAREQQVRDLIAPQAAERAGVDPLSLPPSGRADLAATYDEAIGRAASEPHAAPDHIGYAAQADKQIFDDALAAGGEPAKRAREILAARAEHGIDAQYAASRRVETFGSKAHVSATDELAQGVAEAGPQGPPSLEDMLRTMKSKIDAGESIAGMGERWKSEARGFPTSSTGLQDGATFTVKPSQVEGRMSMDEAGIDRGARLDKQRALMKAGKSEPIVATMKRDGSMEIVSGRHRWLAAAESDTPIAIRLDRAYEGGRFVGDAAHAVEVIGGYEKAMADLARELGPAAPIEAQQMGAAYDAAVDAASAKQARSMAQSVDDAALNVPPGRMTKDQVKAWRDRMTEKVAANDIKSGRSTVYQGDGAGRIIDGERRSMFTRRGVTPLDAEGRAMPEALAGMSASERAAQRAGIDAEQAKRQLWRGSVMERLLTGKETLAEVEKLSGRKLTADEIIDASRDQHLGVIDDAVESEFRSWWKGDRSPIAKEALEAKLGRPVVDDEVAVARNAKASAKGEQKATAQSAKSATETRAKEQAAANVNTPKVAIPSGLGRVAENENRIGGAAGRAEAMGPARAEVAAPKGRIGRAAKAAQDVATMLEAARSLGVPGLPDPHAIPVVGPLLSLYLKARAARAVWSRLGGKIPATAETAIASRAAKMRDSIASSVDHALGVGERVVKRAASPAARTAPLALKALSATLYPSDKLMPKAATVNEAAANQAEMLARAVSKPDEVAAAIRAAVPTNDPDLADALVAAQMRKLTFLQSKAPAVPPPDPMGRKPAPVSTAEAMRFARLVSAVDDPASALRGLADGTITAEVAGAIKTVYPKMFAEIQKRVVERSAQLGAAVPYQSRIRLSVLLDADLDPSMARLSSLQSGLPSMPPGTAPSMGPGLGAGPGGAMPPGPPLPSVAAVPNLVSLYQTSGDRRAAK
jgi:hypothetical protein